MDKVIRLLNNRPLAQNEFHPKLEIHIPYSYKILFADVKMAKSLGKIVKIRLQVSTIFFYSIVSPHYFPYYFSVYGSNLLVPSSYFNSSIKSLITSKVLNEGPVKSFNSFLANYCSHALNSIIYRLQK